MKKLAIVLLFLGVAITAGPAQATIRYEVSVAHPENHVFHVTMTVPQCGRELTVSIPAWNALYQIKDFAFRVQDFRASQAREDSTTATSALVAQKVDKDTWHISPEPNDSHTSSLGTVRIQYNIFWDEPGPFSSQLNPHHAFLNLAEVLFYLPERRAEDTVVSYADLPQGWRAAAELPSAGDNLSFRAPSYDALVDAPTELGNFEEFRFKEGSAAIRAVVDGTTWSRGGLEDILRHVVKTETEMMRETPFTEYLFLFHFGSYREVGGGGMEHMNSSAIATSTDATSAEIIAHEFFHLWNVKRIRPQTLEPVDYTREQYTRALWFAEGVTNTYANYTLLRSGLWGKRQFYMNLAQAFAELDSRPARQWQSAEESSLDAWLEGYDTYNQPNFSISYYNKGQILGVLLDLAIRDATNNQKSLDDVFRAMNDDFAHRGRFYHDSGDIRAEVERVAGKSFQDFFERYVSGTAPIPVNDFLSMAGLELKANSASQAKLGFWPVLAAGNSLIVSELEQESSAEVAGIRDDDQLLTLNGEPFPRDASQWLQGHAPGEIVDVRFRHGGDEREATFALDESVSHDYSVEEEPHATDRQRRIREGLLHGTNERAN